MSPPEPFSVRSDRAGGVERLTPVGELDIATAPVLRAAFDSVFSDAGVMMIVVDLTELSFIDSTGVRVLMEMNEACEQADRLRVINDSPPVTRVLEIAGLRDYLPVIGADSDPLAPLPRSASRPPEY
jgi:anti-sigma B factor antagonist